MPKYIDADEMIKNLTAMKSLYDAIDLDGMIKGIEENIITDVATVVRCKDCAKQKTENCAMYYKCNCGEQHTWENDNDFCSWGSKSDSAQKVNENG